MGVAHVAEFHYEQHKNFLRRCEGNLGGISMTNRGTSKRMRLQGCNFPHKPPKHIRINDNIKAHAERHPNDKTRTVVVVSTEEYKRWKLK